MRPDRARSPVLGLAPRPIRQPSPVLSPPDAASEPSPRSRSRASPGALRIGGLPGDASVLTVIRLLEEYGLEPAACRGVTVQSNDAGGSWAVLELDGDVAARGDALHRRLAAAGSGLWCRVASGADAAVGQAAAGRQRGGRAAGSAGAGAAPSSSEVGVHGRGELPPPRTPSPNPSPASSAALIHSRNSRLPSTMFGPTGPMARPLPEPPAKQPADKPPPEPARPGMEPSSDSRDGTQKANLMGCATNSRPAQLRPSMSSTMPGPAGPMRRALPEPPAE
eukprot:jgi/Tetstr1/466321/TSEL_010852.t1